MKADLRDLRVDARDKIRGQSRYIRDEKIPGLWYGGTVRSPHARARILAITFDPAFNWSSVVTATAKDAINNFVAMPENDMPFLACEYVNYIGEPVVIVAAPDKETLKNALDHVHITYEPLRSILDMMSAELGTVKIFHDDNLFKSIMIERGDLSEAQRLADVVINMEAQTGYQEHLYLEPQGIVAIPEDDRIIIRGSMQCPYYIRKALITLFGETKKITVIQQTTGGAFGGKEDFPSLIAGHAALLANKGGHPVAFFYDREEDAQFTTKRHPSVHRDTAYVREDGRILGLDLHLFLDGGAYCTLSQVVLSRAALAACGSYHVSNIRISAKAVATNTVPSGAFRGFGGPQAIFAIEMLVEKIALALHKSPAEIRRMNMICEGQETATGQILKFSVSAHETFEDTLTRADYVNKYERFKAANQPILEKLRAGNYPKHQPTDKLRGIGICSFLHGAGFTGTGENRILGKLKVTLSEEGMPIIYSASTEMGQGEQSAFRRIMADTLEIDVSDVVVAPVNTDEVPDSGPTVASRTTMVVGSLVMEAGKEIVKQLCESLSAENHATASFANGVFQCGDKSYPFIDIARKHAGLTVEKQYQHPAFVQFDDVSFKGDAYPVFSWGAAVAELEVDPITFEMRVSRYTTTQDIGKAINYDQSVAQIQGGSLQGIGYAIYEKIELRNGHYDITGFTDYIIPTTMEMPEFDVEIMENPYPYGPFGAKGLGELPLVGAAPAVLSALWMIFGTEFSKIPVLPEDLAALFHEGDER